MDLKIVETERGWLGFRSYREHTDPIRALQDSFRPCSHPHQPWAQLPLQRLPRGLGTAPLLGLPQGAVPSRDATQLHDIPSVHPQTQSHSPSPREYRESLPRRAGTFPPPSPCPRVRSRCSPRCPAPAPPRAGSSLPQTPVPGGGAGKARSPPHSPGMCPGSASWEPPSARERYLPFHLPWE